MGNKKKIIKIGIIVLLIIMYISVIFVINKSRPVYKEKNVKTMYEKARVIDVLEDNTTIENKSVNIKKGSMKIEIKILSGKYQGKTYTITNYMSALYNVDVKEGDTISVRIDMRNDGDLDISVYNYYRVNSILIVVGIFAIVLIAIGGKKGFKALIGLVFTLINIVYILLPLTLKGMSPVVVTLIVILISTMISFILLDGISKKTIISTIGTFCGIFIGTIFAIIAAEILNITTYQMDEAESLLLVTSTTKLKIENLLLCGIMISCMGAVMDVAMSIASSIEELINVNNTLTIKELYKSGMNIGSDAMGTMANTLILAFAGNSLNMIILIGSYGVSFQQLINTDFVALEVVKAVAGSIGIIVAVPIVAYIGAKFYLYGRKN